MTGTQPNAVTLVAELDTAGNLPDMCRSAFLTVRRDLFIPARIWVLDPDTDRHYPVDRDAEPDRWLAAVYSDKSIVTQFDDGHTRWPDIGLRATCSASQPSAVAGMLAELDPQPGEHIREIGTGTGYNAALLAHIVGEYGTVTTVEVDRELLEIARANLRTAGVTNVAFEHADAATRLTAEPACRLIATAGVRAGELPYGWVERTRPGGVIVAPMRTDLASGPLVRFTVCEGGTATGRATSRMRVGFMELRGQRVSGAMPLVAWDDPGADVSHTEVAPWLVLLDEAARWAVSLALPRCCYDVWEKTDQRRGVAWLFDLTSGSWATVSPGVNGFVVRQFGPRRLWDIAEHTYRWWQSKGQPPVEAWVWRIEPREQSVTVR